MEIPRACPSATPAKILYTLASPSNLVSNGYFLLSPLNTTLNLVPVWESFISQALTSASSFLIPIQIIRTLFFSL